MGGKSGGSQEVKQRSDPWAGVAPYMADIYAGARANYDRFRTRPGFYPGRTFAGFRPEEQIGQQAGINAAFRQVPRIADQANQALGFSLSPHQLSPAANPYLSQSVQHAITPVFDELTERALPAIRHGSQRAGQDRGASRSQLAQGLATARAARDAMGTAAGMYSSAYGQGLNQMSRGLQAARGIAGLNLLPAQTLMQTGAARRAMDDKAIAEGRARFEHGENAPFQSLQRYASLIQPGYNVGGTSVTSQPTSGSNPLMGAAGGALAGSKFGPWGAAIGGGLGLASSFF